MNTSCPDALSAEIDFSQGQRGKFYRPATRLALPVYLDDQAGSKSATTGGSRGRRCRCIPSRSSALRAPWQGANAWLLRSGAAASTSLASRKVHAQRQHDRHRTHLEQQRIVPAAGEQQV
jgi:hypothetical protein